MLGRGRRHIGTSLAAALSFLALVAAPVAPASAEAAPSVTSLAPVAGTMAGGTVVTLTGAGLSGVSKVMFGTRAGTKLKVLSDTQVSVVAPQGGGTVSVTVTGPAGTSPITDQAQFRYVPTPKVTKLSTSTGSSIGGTSLTITGSSFADVTKVVFGSTSGTALKVESESSLTVVAPKHSTGRVDVRVVTRYGTSSKTSKDRFTFVSPPKVSKVSPAAGRLTGGTRVTIKGLGFNKIAAVNFGGLAGTGLKVSSSSKLTVTSPAGTAGTVPVSVTGAYGTSSTSSHALFTYVAPPTISSLSPIQGSVKGGTKITITGTSFTKVAKVLFGTKKGTRLAVKSRTSLTVVTPAQSSRTVDVVVVTAYGTSTTSDHTTFTYGTPPNSPAPSIIGVVPTNGTTGGGTTLTITGTNLSGTRTITVGGVAATDVSIVDGNTVTAVTPAHAAGVVDVVVTTGAGSVTRVDGFTYVSPALLVRASVRSARGTSANVGLEGVGSISAVNASGPNDGLAWSVAGGRLTVNVAMDATVGQATVGLSGVGCVADDCARELILTVVVTVDDIEAPSDETLDGFPTPSSDRVAAATPVGDQALVMADEVLVTLADGVGGRATADSIATSVGAVVAGGIGDSGMFLLRWREAQDIQARLDQIVSDSRVASAEGTFLQAVTSNSIPTDGDESGYGNGDNRWHLDMIHAPEAWQHATGSGVKIGIFELEFAATHRDLPPSENRFGAGQGDARDVKHATHVTGLACAQDNGLGVIGVAPECTLEEAASYSVTTVISGTQGAGSASGATTTTYYAFDDQLWLLTKLIKAGSRVVNMSLGRGFDCRAITGEYEDGHFDACDSDDLANYENTYQTWASYQRGESNSFATVMNDSPQTLLVIAAGNEGLPKATNFWGTYAAEHNLGNVLNVASVDEDGHLSYFSNFGGEIDIAAPGGYQVESGNVVDKSVWSTIPDNDYGYDQGTSMAAPVVTGTAALVAQLHHDWTGERIAHTLISSATREVSARNEAGDLKFGFAGSIPLLDAASAVMAAKGLIDPPDGRGGDDYIARDPDTGRSVNVIAGVPYLITTGPDFNCLAESRYVWDIGTLGPLNVESPGAVLSCDNTGRTVWDYRPEADGGTIPNDTILRDPAGHAWLINSAGEIQTILDGGTYLCLAYNNPVIWNVPDSAVNSWSPVGSTPATCGGIRSFAATSATDLGVGYDHTCVRTGAGGVECWGSNADGQLGDGTFEDQDEPHLVPGVASGARQVAVGAYHTCAAMMDGRVLCWGRNNAGQLGDGTDTSRAVPTVVLGIDDAIGVVAGDYHTCAWNAVGTLWCWGSNNSGQLGEGTTNDRLTPVGVEGTPVFSRGIVGASAGPSSTCITSSWTSVADDGTVTTSPGDGYCWGANGYGEIRQSATNIWTTMTPSVFGGPLQIAVGNTHICSRDTTGAIHCSGDNRDGESGRDASQATKVSNWAVPLSEGSDDVAAGDSFTCALLKNGQVACWGSNQDGQLGDNTEGFRADPKPVPGIEGAREIDARGSRMCVLLQADVVTCWGGRQDDNSGGGD